MFPIVTVHCGLCGGKSFGQSFGGRGHLTSLVSGTALPSIHLRFEPDPRGAARRRIGQWGAHAADRIDETGRSRVCSVIHQGKTFPIAIDGRRST